MMGRKPEKLDADLSSTANFFMTLGMTLGDSEMGQ